MSSASHFRVLWLLLWLSPLVCLYPTAVSCQECRAWQWANPRPTASPLKAVTWGDGQFVAVGWNGTIVTSQDGVNWVTQAAVTSDNLEGVVWGDQQFEAVTWTGSRFVIVGNNGLVLTSPDAKDWQAHDVGIDGHLVDVTWHGGQAVAVGSDDGAIFTSQDLTSWVDCRTSIMEPLGSAVALDDVTWGGGQFVAIGEAGTIITSLDAIHWWHQVAQVSVDLHGIAWGANQYVAVGANGSIITSPDGGQWTTRSSGTRMTLYEIAWGNDRFVAVGTGGTIRTSRDGMIWAPQSSGTSDNLNAVVWGHNEFVAVGDQYTILTSPDGANWTSRPSLGQSMEVHRYPHALWGVAWGNGEYVLVGYEDVGPVPRGVVPDGSIFQTPDWVRWKWTLEFTDGMLKDVVWGADQFIMVSGDFDPNPRRHHSVAIVTLTSETEWLSHAKNLKTNVTRRRSLHAITWGAGQFVAVGGAESILRKVCSPDVPHHRMVLPGIRLLLLE